MNNDLSQLKKMETKDLLGFPIREKLYSGEDAYFKQNPHVGGMAAEDNSIILNPYSSGEVNQGAVAKNEALRLLLRMKKPKLDFELTPSQIGQFKGTPYQDNEEAMKHTILGRIYSEDPTALDFTEEQTKFLNRFLERK